MLTVFISSTYRDLVDHRRAMVQALSEAGYHPIAMEHFGSQPGDATTVSEDEVRRADLFVGIYAHRYGYRPANGKSVTEMEYDAARKAGIDCLVFVVEDGYREGSLGDHAETNPDSISLLNDFKERLNTAHVRATFNTPDSLAARVMASVAKWDDRRGGDAEHEQPPVPPATPTIGSINISGSLYGPIGSSIGRDFVQNISTQQPDTPAPDQDPDTPDS